MRARPASSPLPLPELDRGDAGSIAVSDEVAAIPLGHRWIVDGFSVIPCPQGLITLLCDMTQALRAMTALRARGLHATPTHLLVRAAALALQRHPDTHRLVCGYHAIRPARVDIGLSVAGQTSYAPVLVIQDVGRKRLSDLVPEMVQGVAEARRKEGEDLRGMRRTGWVVPWGALRRLILRWLYRSFWFRRRLAGTFQVTCLNDVDQAFPLAFYTGSALAMGRVADRVVAVGGAPVVRPMAWLTLALDHKALDGRTASRLLNAVREILEGEELVQEASI